MKPAECSKVGLSMVITRHDVVHVRSRFLAALSVLIARPDSRSGSAFCVRCCVFFPMGLRAADDAKLSNTACGCQPLAVILSEAKDLASLLVTELNTGESRSFGRFAPSG